MKQEREWPREWTAEIGRAVARHRKLRGMSAQALSDKCAEIGFPIPRNTITNLENGRKEGIPVHEVLILARALDVAAMDLLFPMAREDGLAPGFDDLRAEALWFVQGTGDIWGRHRSEFNWYQRHQADFRRAFARVFTEGASEDWVAAGVGFLADTRDEMTRLGLPLPPLPPEVAWWLQTDTSGIPRYKMGTPDDLEREGQMVERLKSSSKAARRPALEETGSADG